MPGRCFVWLAIVALATSALGAAASLSATASARASPRDAAAAEARWRGPAALWLAPDGTTLFAACEKSGGIAVIDTASRELVVEVPVGKSLVALAATPDGRTIAVCDAAANLLTVLERDGRQIKIRRHVPVPTKPVGVAIAPDGRTCFVASLWSRQVSRIDLATGALIAKIDLDFAPQQLLVLPDGHTLVVASSFSGKLALVDCRDHSVARVVDIPGHNIRGMAVTSDGTELLVSHMILTESAGTTRDNVFWGITMTSNLRIIPVAALLDPTKNVIREANTHFFSDPGNAAGDPTATCCTADGRTLVCLSGVGQIAIGRYQPTYGFSRVGVGERPRAMALSSDERLAYVANANSDSISLIDIKREAAVSEIPLGPAPRLSLAEQGERLFYDARLSLDGWFSCHSCHTDGHTNGQKADTLADGTYYGTPKTILSLLGTGDTGPWAWNGSKKFLEDQVRDSLRQTMQPKSPPTERQVAAITAYLRTLGPPPVAEWQRSDAAAIARGERVFSDHGCATCHTPPTYTNPQVFDVGLDDGEGGNKRFSPPSLRGVAHAAPYFHDGRAKTLEAVFRDFQHRVWRELPDADRNDLIAFLKSL